MNAQNIVDASPTKRFFVEMLTRDIELEDAILDLLDNCVDGMIRTNAERGGAKASREYEKFKASIDFDTGKFELSDNCGGIPRDVATKYAFIMGRRKGDHRDEDIPTIGVYGIGMKRAIFKMGKEARVDSRRADDAFHVSITPQWMQEDGVASWTLPLGEGAEIKTPGTRIKVTQLNSEVMQAFNSKESPFEEDLRGKIAAHYAIIIEKGFQVTVNGKPVRAEPLLLLSNPRLGMAPFMYDADLGGVNVQLTVGLYDTTADDDDDDDDDESATSQRSRARSGWTIVCNDRVVVLCDKTRLTGWGEATVPNFHPQYIGIAGIVHFRSNTALLLPINTTKRGIEAGSDLYLQVKDHMRAGTKLFTDYTNRWKKQAHEEREVRRGATAASPDEIRKQIDAKDWTKVRGKTNEKRYQPKLPEPKNTTEDVIVRFTKPAVKVKRLAKLLLDDPNASASAVGSLAFDMALKSK